MEAERDTAIEELDLWDSIRNAVLDQIASQSTVLVVGAGISLWKPSSLPSGKELLRGVVDGLICAEVKPIIQQSEIARVCEYPPEIVFQAIQEMITDKHLLLTIYEALKGVSPNLCHVVLGRAAALGWQTLFTTNLDCLIEEAAEGCIDLAYSESGFRLKNHTPQLFKLHGTAGGNTEQEHTERFGSIQLALHQMGAGFSDQKRLVLEQATKGMSILFIGYSGGDYDVCSFLGDWLQNGDGRILWNVAPGADVSGQYPHVWKLRKQYRGRVVIFQRDLRDLFKDIAAVWNVEVSEELVTLAMDQDAAERKARVADRVRPWAVSLSDFDKMVILAWVLFCTNNFLGAEAVAKCSARLTPHPAMQALSCFIVGCACREQSKHDQALDWLWRAYRGFDIAGDQYRKAQALHKIAEVCSTWERMNLRHFCPNSLSHDGLRHIRQALALYDSNAHDEPVKGMQRLSAGWAVLNEAQILHRIGSCWLQFVPVLGRAVANRLDLIVGEKLAVALTILKRSGDLRGVAQAEIVLADVKPKTSHASVGGVLSTEWTMDLVHQGSSLYRQGSASIRAGQVSAACEQFEAAVACYQTAGAQAEIAAVAATLAVLYFKLHEREKAVHFFEMFRDSQGRVPGSALWKLLAWKNTWRCWLWYRARTFSARMPKVGKES